MSLSARWKGVRVAFGAWLVASALVGCAVGGSSPAEPQRIAVEAQPNGIAVRPGDGAIFITDDTTNSVLTATDNHHPFTRFAALPAVPGQDRNSLSQLVFADPRALLVAQFGFGTSGALVEIAARETNPDTKAGQVTTFTGPDPVRRRLGLAVLGPGQVLSTWFVKQGNAPQYGGLSLISYDASTGRATEQTWMTGLVKPVGVAVANGNVYVSDEANNRILKARIDALRTAPQPASSATVVAQIDGPDLLAAGRDGTLYTKCSEHGFCRIAADGTVTQLANDFNDARGVALDETRHVVYVVDRGNASKHMNEMKDTKGTKESQNESRSESQSESKSGSTSEVRVLPLR
jgi:DNA-binding beta-propeller fold protein YncE